MRKKSNIIAVNLSDFAISLLQESGWLDHNKRVTGRKNLSRYFSELVIDDFGARSVVGRADLLKRVLVRRVNELTAKRNGLDEMISAVASEIAMIREKPDVKISKLILKEVL